MLSGAVYAFGGDERFDTLVISKLRRLIVPYYIYGMLFMLPVKYLGGFYTADNLKLALTGFQKGMEAGHLWFLPALFWCFIVFYPIKKYVSEKSLCAALLAAFFIQECYPAIPFSLFLFPNGMEYFFWFSLGFCFQKSGICQRLKDMNSTPVFAAVLSAAVILNQKWKFLDPFFVVLTYSFWAWCLAAAAEQYFPRIKHAKLYKLLLANSFAIYIFHDPLEYIVLRMTFHFNLLTTASGCYIDLMMRTAGVIVFSILLNRIVQWVYKKYLKYYRCSRKVITE